jgi:hypothetical protein
MVIVVMLSPSIRIFTQLHNRLYQLGGGGRRGQTCCINARLLILAGPETMEVARCLDHEVENLK